MATKHTAVVRALHDEVGMRLPDGTDTVLGEYDTPVEAWKALADHHQALEDAAGEREHLPGCPWSAEAGYHHAWDRLHWLADDDAADAPDPDVWVFADTPGACLCPEHGIADRDYGRVYLVR